MEIHNGVPIYYSLGNFLFTRNSKYKDWYLGMVVEVDVSKDQLVTQVHFIRQDERNFKLSLINDPLVVDRFNAYSNIIVDKGRLSMYWNDFVREKSREYLTSWSANGQLAGTFFGRIVNKLGLRLLTKRGAALYLNLMRCEAHRDVSKVALKEYIERR